jgi:hypothetical protein
LVNSTTEHPPDNHIVSDKYHSEEEEYWFRVTDVCVFPPQRRYLVVAALEASPAWHAIHDDLRSIAKNSSSWSPALAQIAKASKERWIPHITLGNLFGGTKTDLQILSDVSRNLSPEPDTSLNETAFFVTRLVIAKAIALGGPIPTQASLDWDFIKA